ncbi:MAG: RNA-processing protein, partial [Candidatus Aenigmarchaeota archaeon]|nr:RNA-processing protein [Candidatus Aenigmarchaeota archaeon]
DAVKKLKKEDYDLIVINLESVVGHKSKDIERYKGRVIGQGGKTKKYIETATNTEICLSGKTVSIIGNSADAHHAKEAIGIIIDGAEIKTLYSYLYKVRKEQEESELLGI